MAFAIGGPVQRAGGFGGPSAPGMGGGGGPIGVGGPMQRAGGMQSFKKGGKVKKTGLAHVHKNERVLTKKQQKNDLKSSAKKEMK